MKVLVKIKFLSSYFACRYHQVRSIDRNIAINIWWDHHTMINQDFTDCQHATANHITMADCHFHGTAKLLQNQDAIK